MSPDAQALGNEGEEIGEGHRERIRATSARITIG